MIIAIIIVVIVIILVIIYRYIPKKRWVNCSFKITDSATVLPQVKGDAFDVNTCVDLEVVSTNSARTLGLSGRKAMDKNKGMLLDFRQPGKYCIWMKDMNFALDVLWLNERYEIDQMMENVTPDTYPKSFCGPSSSRYIVEVRDGVVRLADLHIGQRIKL